MDTVALLAEISLLKKQLADAVSVVRCEDCEKSHLDGKTTHYLGNRKILFFRGLVRACEREN